MKKTGALLLIGGTGVRFDRSLPKQFHLLAGKPVYQYALETLVASRLFDVILIVCHPAWIHKISEDIRVIPGGSTRQESVYLGLVALKNLGFEMDPEHIVLIHDGARPFVTEDLLKQNLLLARTQGAVNTCIPSTDTLVVSTDQKEISSIPLRSTFFRGQTPQTFPFDQIFRAHMEAIKNNRTNASDDGQLILEANLPLFIIPGSEQNLKITSPLDLKIAATILESMSAGSKRDS